MDTLRMKVESIFSIMKMLFGVLIVLYEMGLTTKKIFLRAMANLPGV